MPKSSRPSALTNTPARRYTELMEHLAQPPRRHASVMQLLRGTSPAPSTATSGTAMPAGECHRALRSLHWTLLPKACRKALLFLYTFNPGPPPENERKAFSAAQKRYQESLDVSVSQEQRRHGRYRSGKARTAIRFSHRPVEDDGGCYLFPERQPAEEVATLLINATWRLFEVCINDENRARAEQAPPFISENLRAGLTLPERVFNLWWSYWTASCAFADVANAFVDARLIGVDQLPFTDKERMRNNRIVFNGREWEALSHLTSDAAHRAQTDARTANRSLLPPEGRWAFMLAPPEPEVITGLEEIE